MYKRKLEQAEHLTLLSMIDRENQETEVSNYWHMLSRKYKCEVGQIDIFSGEIKEEDE